MSTSQESSLVTVGLLGPVRLSVDGRVVAVTSGRVRHLLAFLAVNANTSVSVDRLVDVVWPDKPMESAVSALRTNIWRLRNLLGEGAEHRRCSPRAALSTGVGIPTGDAMGRRRRTVRRRNS